MTEAGVTYPSTATVELPDRPPTPGTAALDVAADRTGRALEAAVAHAAASAAARRVDAEQTATVRRLRAIRDRWLPRLEAELAETDLRLDETEREEISRLLWTIGQRDRRDQVEA